MQPSQLHLFAPTERIAVAVLDRNDARSRWALRKLNRSKLLDCTYPTIDDLLRPDVRRIPDCVVVYVPGRDVLGEITRLERLLPQTAVVALVDGVASLALEALQAGAEEYLTLEECRLANVERAVTDAVHRKIGETRTVRQASLDPLTALVNRAGLAEEFADWVQRPLPGTGVAVLAIDLDRFKPVNDTYGHAVGDRLLFQVAERLRECVRGHDVVARLGGDEFVILMRCPEVERAARNVADRVVDRLEREFRIDGRSIAISGSVGIAVRHDGEEPQATLVRADMALYEAKRAGRARWIGWDDDLAERVARDDARALDVVGALRAEAVELRLSPVDCLDLRHATLLARVIWPVEDEELLPARLPDRGRFAIELFEWTVDRLVLRHAVDPLPLGTRVLIDAPRALVHRVGQAMSWLERFAGVTGIRPVLVFEEADLPHPDQFEELASEITARGFLLALGGFGGGGARLATLEEWPWAAVWLDADLVDGIAIDPVRRARLGAVLQITGALGLPVGADAPASLADLDTLVATNRVCLPGAARRPVSEATGVQRVVRVESPEPGAVITAQGVVASDRTTFGA